MNNEEIKKKLLEKRNIQVERLQQEKPMLYANVLRSMDDYAQLLSQPTQGECQHNYVYKIMHDHKAADICTKCGDIKLQKLTGKE